jgi:hypothetical protein
MLLKRILQTIANGSVLLLKEYLNPDLVVFFVCLSDFLCDELKYHYHAAKSIHGFIPPRRVSDW